MNELPVAISEDAPSGENLEYDQVFTDLLLAAQPGEERQAGNEIIEAEPPNGRAMIEKAKAVLSQSHDLRAAVILAHGELLQSGMVGFASATGYIRRALGDYWETCHPQLDTDDENDPTMRINAVLGLVESDTILRALRLAPLTHSNAFGRITLRDILIAGGDISAPEDIEKIQDAASISAAFQDTKPDVMSQIFEAARASFEDVKAINSTFDERLPGQGPDLDPLLKMLKRIVSTIASAIGEARTDATDDDTAADVQSPAEVRGAPGTITSSRDVVVALDRIIDYYARHEPSSPLPIMLRRAKRLVGADFLTIIKDMAPSGAESVNHIGGLNDDVE